MSTFLQWTHLTAAVLGIGGLAFLLFVLTPSLGNLPPEQRDLLAQQVMSRFRWVLWPSILVLLASGLYSIREYYWEVAWGKSWRLLTAKIVLALLVFVIAIALTLPFKVFNWMRSGGQIWLAIAQILLAIALGLAVAVIYISAYLRRG